MISAPSNFNHISHMGPGDGIQMQRLLDLPSALEKADQFGGAHHQQHQVSGSSIQHLSAGIPLAGMSTSSSSTSITGSPSHLLALQQQQQQQGIQRVYQSIAMQIVKILITNHFIIVFIHLGSEYVPANREQAECTSHSAPAGRSIPASKIHITFVRDFVIFCSQR